MEEVKDRIGTEPEVRWGDIAFVAAITNLFMFVALGVPLSLLLDSDWPAIIFIIPLFIGGAVACIAFLVREWRRVLS